jgi:hypothetical protein
MKRTCWTITEDHIADPKAEFGTNANAQYLCGPGEVDAIIEEWNARTGPLWARIASHPQAVPFRMLDDDGELYYTGAVLIGDEEDAELKPLDDFGKPNAGATTIELRRGPVWEQV